MQKILGLLVFSAIAGCTPTRPVPIATGFTAISSQSSLEVGHLYFTGGKKLAFSTTDGTNFYELCYDDFDMTKALMAISDHVVEVGIDVAKHTSNPKFKISAETMVPFLPAASIGSDRQYVLENLRRFELTGTGMDIVRDNLGEACKSEIAGHQAKNHTVIIVAAAQRADTVTDTVTRSLGAQIETPIGSLGPSAEDKAVTEYKLVYLSALMQAPPVAE